jgi:hypothetical protein
MSDFRCKSEEMMAIAATEVQDDIRGPGPSPLSQERESVFEQPLRVTVLLRRSRCGTSIKERPDIRGVIRRGGFDTTKG